MVILKLRLGIFDPELGLLIGWNGGVYRLYDFQESNNERESNPKVSIT